jgi:hypothetical protein
MSAIPDQIGLPHRPPMPPVHPPPGGGGGRKATTEFHVTISGPNPMSATYAEEGAAIEHVRNALRQWRAGVEHGVGAAGITASIGGTFTPATLPREVLTTPAPSATGGTAGGGNPGGYPGPPGPPLPA